MSLYTSNYARKGSDPNAIAISRLPPKWFTGLHLPTLAPTWDMIKGIKEGSMTQYHYTKQYVAILNNIKMNDWSEWLQQLLDQSYFLYFLCFESPSDFCHRHIFSAWIKDNCGWDIPEWKNQEELKKQEQSNLVDDLFNF